MNNQICQSPHSYQFITDWTDREMTASHPILLSRSTNNRRRKVFLTKAFLVFHPRTRELKVQSFSTHHQLTIKLPLSFPKEVFLFNSYVTIITGHSGILTHTQRCYYQANHYFHRKRGKQLSETHWLFLFIGISTIKDSCQQQTTNSVLGKSVEKDLDHFMSPY